MGKVLDLFCGAGGAAQGYIDAGYEVTGVDICPQPRFPGHFVQGDALDYAIRHGHQYDLVHASPPCQAYSITTNFTGNADQHPDLIADTRDVLLTLGKPYVIENVPGARDRLKNPLMLRGTMFGLLVIRHRLFETSPSIYFAPAPCAHLRPVVKHGRPPDPDKHYAGVTGNFSGVAFARRAMGIDWMTGKELSQAIPPAYTEFIGARIFEIMHT